METGQEGVAVSSIFNLGCSMITVKLLSEDCPEFTFRSQERKWKGFLWGERDKVIDYSELK